MRLVSTVTVISIEKHVALRGRLVRYDFILGRRMGSSFSKMFSTCTLDLANVHLSAIVADIIFLAVTEVFAMTTPIDFTCDTHLSSCGDSLCLPRTNE